MKGLHDRNAHLAGSARDKQLSRNAFPPRILGWDATAYFNQEGVNDVRSSREGVLDCSFPRSLEGDGVQTRHHPSTALVTLLARLGGIAWSWWLHQVVI
jgi:hypothetical protein